jgi:hypothetical protein
LFFVPDIRPLLDFSDFAAQLPDQPHSLFDFRGIPLNRGALHVLLAAEQLEIFQLAVAVVAVFPPDAIALRDRAVRILPNSLVNKFPICAVSSDAGVRLIRDFANQIAVSVELDRADRGPVAVRGSRSLAFFELCLAHAAGCPSRSTGSLIRRHLPFVEAMRSADNSQPFTLHVIK